MVARPESGGVEVDDKDRDGLLDSLRLSVLLGPGSGPGGSPSLPRPGLNVSVPHRVGSGRWTGEGRGTRRVTGSTRVRDEGRQDILGWNDRVGGTHRSGVDLRPLGLYLVLINDKGS